MTDSPSADIGALPSGASWRKCAFQVNPFPYLLNHQSEKATLAGDEDSYNSSLVEALVEQGVGIIGLADHWSATSGESLRRAAQDAGILVFPGFEATTHENLHLIVLFDPSESVDSMKYRIGKCGIPPDCVDSRPGELTALQLLEEANSWNAVVIAPHVTTERGLLHTLSGQAAVAAWCDPNLHAVGVTGGQQDPSFDRILKNTNPEYRREHPVALLHAADVSGPEDLPETHDYDMGKDVKRNDSGTRHSIPFSGNSYLNVRTCDTQESGADWDRLGWWLSR